MVIVHTTVWIDYLQGLTNSETDWVHAELERQRLGLTDLILCRGAPREAWDSCVAANSSTISADAYDTVFEDRVAGVEHLCAESRTGRAGVRFLRRGHRNVSCGVRLRGPRRWYPTHHALEYYGTSDAEWTAQQFRVVESNGHELPDGHRVVATPILGGLHHEYRLETAA